MQTMYSGKINSPSTTLNGAIDNSQTSITVTDASVLPTAPNLAVIGTGSTAETVLYTGISTNTLTGCTRGYEGSASAWSSGTNVARNFTNRDHASFLENINDINRFLDTYLISLGIVQDGVTNNTTLVNTAISTLDGLGIKQIVIPYNSVYSLGSLTIPDAFLIIDKTRLNNYAPVRVFDWSATTTRNSYHIDRNIQKTGGTPGYVNSALRINTNVGANVASYEWGLTSVLYNYTTAGDNVAVYGQGNKYSTGAAFGGVFEARDYSGVLGNGLIGAEFDVFANGADGQLKRLGIDVVVGKAVSEGAACVADIGIRIGPVYGDSTQGSFTNGIYLAGNMTIGLRMSHNGTWGIRGLGSVVVGIDLSEMTVSSAAIRIKADDYIALEGTGTMKFKYSAATGYIEFYNGATRMGYIDMNGADHAL